MPSIVEHSVEIDVPTEVVFTYVDDFTNTRDWMYGLDRLEHVGGDLHGIGAEYDGTMKLGVSLTSRIRCTAYEENRLIELDSVKGIRNTQRWAFTPLPGDRTRVDARVTYSLPGGPAGATMAVAIKPLVGIAVKHTSEALVRNLEGRSPA